MNPVGWLGLTLFAVGLGHRWRPLARLDAALFCRAHRALRRAPHLWRALWPLGTSAAGGGVMLALWLGETYTRRAALLPASVATRSTPPFWHAVLVYLGLAALEPAVKRLLRRPRPFTYLSDVQVQQPRRPHDPSFPSGDAMRVWFLAPLAATLLGGGALLWGILIALAALVSLGRVALGVHHPLDVLAGAGLGLLGFAIGTML